MTRKRAPGQLMRGVTLDLTPEDHAALRRVVEHSPYPTAASWMRAQIRDAEALRIGREAMGAPPSAARQG